VYNRWQGNAIVARPAGPVGGASIARSGHDIYAGHDGQVWDHRGNSWYRQGSDGSWSKSQPEKGLEDQRQSRSLGSSRWSEFRGMGSHIGGGMPHTFSGGFGGGGRGFGGGRR
jgi:hypothetical protein